MLLDRAYLGARQWSMPRWLLRSKIWSEYNFFILHVESTWCARTNSSACFFNFVHFKVGVSERALRTWLKTYEEEGVLKASNRGRHSKTISPIVDPDFRDKFCFHVKSNSRNNGEAYHIISFAHWKVWQVLESAFTCMHLRWARPYIGNLGKVGQLWAEPEWRGRLFSSLYDNMAPSMWVQGSKILIYQ